MKRRNFFGLLAGVIVAPFIPGVVAKSNENRVVIGQIHTCEGVALPVGQKGTTIVIKNNGVGELRIHGSEWVSVSEYAGGRPVPAEFGSIEGFTIGSGKIKQFELVK